MITLNPRNALEKPSDHIMEFFISLKNYSTLIEYGEINLISRKEDDCSSRRKDCATGKSYVSNATPDKYLYKIVRCEELKELAALIKVNNREVTLSIISSKMRIH